MSHNGILIIEDDHDIRENLSLILEYEGYTVYTAEHGQDALEKLAKMTTMPCMMLLDMMMPVVDGLTFIHKLKELMPNVHANMNIVVMSAAGLLDLEKFGAKQLIRKPINLQKLLTVVTQYCV